MCEHAMCRDVSTSIAGAVALATSMSVVNYHLVCRRLVCRRLVCRSLVCILLYARCERGSHTKSFYKFEVCTYIG